MAFGFHHLDKNNQHGRRQQMQASGHPFEHVTRMVEAVNAKCARKANQQKDYNDKGYFCGHQVLFRVVKGMVAETRLLLLLVAFSRSFSGSLLAWVHLHPWFLINLMIIHGICTHRCACKQTLRIYRIYSNRGRSQIEAYSNTSRNVRASPSSLNHPIFKN